MEPKGIKELVELIAGIEVVAVAAKEVMKDGKLSFDDAQALVKLGEKIPVLLAAIDGLKEIPAEAKELDMAEMMELIGKLYALADKVQKA